MTTFNEFRMQLAAARAAQEAAFAERDAMAAERDATLEKCQKALSEAEKTRVAAQQECIRLQAACARRSEENDELRSWLEHERGMTRRWKKNAMFQCGLVVFLGVFMIVYSLTR